MREQWIKNYIRWLQRLWLILSNLEKLVPWTVNYTGTQSYITTLAYSLSIKFVHIHWIGNSKLVVSTLLTNDFELYKGNLVHYHGGYTLIYRWFSYPLRSRVKTVQPKIIGYSNFIYHNFLLSYPLISLK